MALYRYQHGDRPLDGYTIRHGLGRGGFGEVYYAVSDSGREVAIKAVQNYGEVELRGIKHCMNLKNPHLVSIFDIRHNDHQLPFVIMEYVDGPSLRDILDAHEGGLGPEKAAFFLREIVKGLAYLHECGVVHRDLKPHNVFYEQGVVKIGDYSLSKAISTSHRTGHTVTVGTVHYMAPEISMGRYDHTVDIYALGVLLYEMLTGQPPFLGDSMGEVLMKHMAGDVDLTGIDPTFARVIQKALQKEAQDRYQSAEEMVADLMGNEALEQSVEALGPESLTVIAEKAVRWSEEARAKEHNPPPLPTAARGEPVGATATVTAKARAKQLGNTYPYTFDVRNAPAVRALKSSPQTPIAWFFFILAMVIVSLAVARGVGSPSLFVIMIVVLVVALVKKGKQAHALAPPSGSGDTKASRPPQGSTKPEGAPRVQPVAKVKAQEPKYVAEPIDPLLMRSLDESPYSRLVALIMSGLFFVLGIAGIQRLYVGKIKSGILWLLTFGLFGIGQIYDTIMIAVGQFRDSEGRLVLDFSKDVVQSLKQPVNQYSAVVRKKWTDSRVGFKLGNLVFNLIGAVFLFVALGLGAIVATDLPEAVASGVFTREFAEEIVEETHMRDWNVVLSFMLGIGTVIAGTVAAVCLILARRESTWTHMLRIPVATAAFVGSVVSLGTTTGFGRRWGDMAYSIHDRMVGEALNKLLRTDFWPGLIMACLLFVVAIFILAWPARRRVVTETYHVPVEEARQHMAQHEHHV